MSTAWVWVTSATSLSFASRSSVCTTIVVRPACSGRVVARTSPSRTARKKLVDDEIVEVDAPGGQVEERAHRAGGVGERHDRAAVHHARGRAALRRPRRGGRALLRPTRRRARCRTRPRTAWWRAASARSIAPWSFPGVHVSNCVVRRSSPHEDHRRRAPRRRHRRDPRARLQPGERAPAAVGRPRRRLQRGAVPVPPRQRPDRAAALTRQRRDVDRSHGRAAVHRHDRQLGLRDLRARRRHAARELHDRRVLQARHPARAAVVDARPAHRRARRLDVELQDDELARRVRGALDRRRRDVERSDPGERAAAEARRLPARVRG